VRRIVLDTETTGLNFAEDRIVEIGCVEIDGFNPTGKTYHAYVNPLRKVHPEAFRVHGLSDVFLASKPTFKRVVNRFLKFIGDAPLIIHNAPFDTRMLNGEMKRLGLPNLENEIIDTLKMSRDLRPGGKHTLDALLSAYKIDGSRRSQHHGALIDSELLAEVYVELCGGRQIGFGLVVEKAVEEVMPVRRRSAPLASRVTDEDRAAHRAFVETLGEKAIWNEYLAPKEIDKAA
jgi:DNA polymerase-3 subunit epsilon